MSGIRASPASAGECAGRPARHGHVVGVPGRAIGAEREHGVRLHALGDVAQPTNRCCLVDVGAAAVRVVQPDVLGDAHLGEAGGEFAGAYLSQRRPGGPPLLIG